MPLGLFGCEREGLTFGKIGANRFHLLGTAAGSLILGLGSHYWWLWRPSLCHRRMTQFGAGAQSRTGSLACGTDRLCSATRRQLHLNGIDVESFLSIFVSLEA